MANQLEAYRAYLFSPLTLIGCCVVIAMLLLWRQNAGATSAPVPPSFSIAFYYAANPPAADLHAFDIVVVDPDTSGLHPARYNTASSTLFAYTSVGEADPRRSHFTEMDPTWLVGDNASWKSKVVDVSNPAWQTFFLDKVIEPLWQAGYRGFFLDTMDSYQLAPEKMDRTRLREGLVATIKGIRQRHPEARLILNRGFELLPSVKSDVYAVAAESLYQTFDPATGAYREVKEQDRAWLLARLEEVRQAGLPAIVIDYLPPGSREQARTTAAQIRKQGYVPWVTDKDLATIGIGAVEMLPRTILALYSSDDFTSPDTPSDVVYTQLHRFAAMPLNHLGYRVEMRNMAKALPGESLAGRYAGVLIWVASSSAGTRNGLMQWVKRQTSDGVKVVFLDSFGVPPEQAAAHLGLDFNRQVGGTGQLQVAATSASLSFETEPIPRNDSFVPVRTREGTPLITVKAADGSLGDMAALTPWGGYLLSPFVVMEGIGDDPRWVVDPFTFLPQAFQFPLVPVPDTTTENGSRMLLVHIDADGFESKVERHNGPLAATELRERILKKYRIPTTVSLITSMLDEAVTEPATARMLQQEAREIMALPWVEAASHTFSHPFYWQKSSALHDTYGRHNLDIPGYTFSLTNEIQGSADFINQRILPPGKKVGLLQWSGNCTPGVDALAETYRAGLRNINGGETTLTEDKRSLTKVAPLGVFKGGYFQVFAPNQNENIYTNNWNGPFFGFQRVIESFRLTDFPRRLKPVNIYYHFYSATKEASLQALDDVYTWAVGQSLLPVFTTSYVDRVMDYNATAIALTDRGWLVRNGGQLRELRVPVSAGYPDLAAETRVMGYRDHGADRYLHLAPGGDVLIRLSGQQPVLPFIRFAGGEITSFARTAKGFRVTLVNPVPAQVGVSAAKNCVIRTEAGKQLFPKRQGTDIILSLPEGTHVLELTCK